MEKKISLLYPVEYETEYKKLSAVTIHDLGLDMICKKVSSKESEQELILATLSRMTKDARVSTFRGDVFSDIHENPEMRNRLMEILEKINFLFEYGSFKRPSEEKAGIWDLLHRLDELKDYIQCVEAIYICLSDVTLKSQGLQQLKEYIQTIYHDNGFEELKRDVMNLKVTTGNLKSVTLGINLTENFEANGIGLISVNNKYFTKSNIIGNFCDRFMTKEGVKEGTQWNEDYKFHELRGSDSKYSDSMERFRKANLTMVNSIIAPIASVSDGDPSRDLTRYMDDVAEHMLSSIVKKLKRILDKYVSITIRDITDLIPEFIYYIRWAEYIENLIAAGNHFCKALPEKNLDAEPGMKARGIYNLKLVAFESKEHEAIVTNDLDFDKEHFVYILTGANRGGKTTITQAIGQLFVLAQGGIFVPGDAFTFSPVDCIYTHFPADEDKTMDFGRLGEECKRFRELYFDSTKDSLLLLNETFSTTSFEEGYFIARDSVKAILKKGVRTIYNTHMHKLAFDIEEMNQVSDTVKASSLIMKADGGNRSYKVAIAPPEGMSYANDIAKKYGVTFEMLTKA